MSITSSEFRREARAAMVPFRMSHQEREELNSRARSLGLTTQEYLLRLVFDPTIRDLPAEQVYRLRHDSALEEPAMF